MKVNKLITELHFLQSNNKNLLNSQLMMTDVLKNEQRERFLGYLK